MKVTEPVGVPAPVPDTVAWSVTLVPRATEVTGVVPDSTEVSVWVAALVTVKSSHDPVEPR